MNRNILGLGAAALALIAAPMSMAAPSVAPPIQTINIGGSVDLLCGGSGLTNATLNLTNSLANAQGFIDDTAYVGKSASVGSLWCNGVNSTATVTHVNLTNTTAPNAISANFTHVVTFVPQVTFTPTVGTPVVINGDVTNTVIGAFTGSASVSLLSGGTANNNLRPLAGAYAGSVSFTVTPAS
ncbi:MAG TPA: hypothetical protein VHW60_20630 [Caulobacteraceae bacterium]|jgi:hypothetical protein|nr:hypothetical protein [Caulobacteraceae bacterium]